MLPTRDPPQNKISRQTESERLEKNIFQANGQEKKKIWGNNTYITQNRLQNKTNTKRH